MAGCGELQRGVNSGGLTSYSSLAMMGKWKARWQEVLDSYVCSREVQAQVQVVFRSELDG